jgi:excisionase family DNA binding protein
MLTISEFAREVGVKPSFIQQLINERRIPEARRDSGGRYRIPARRVVIPSRYPRSGAKINGYFYRRDEIPMRWIADPESRPEPGVILKGSEDESLASRIEKTFDVSISQDLEDRGSERNVEFTSANADGPIRAWGRSLESWINDEDSGKILLVVHAASSVIPARLVGVSALGVLVLAHGSRAAKKLKERGVTPWDSDAGEDQFKDSADGDEEETSSLSELLIPWSEVELLEKPIV